MHEAYVKSRQFAREIIIYSNNYLCAQGKKRVIGGKSQWGSSDPVFFPEEKTETRLQTRWPVAKILKSSFVSLDDKITSKRIISRRFVIIKSVEPVFEMTFNVQLFKFSSMDGFVVNICCLSSVFHI